jgi:hypothetical protein
MAASAAAILMKGTSVQRKQGKDDVRTIANAEGVL